MRGFGFTLAVGIATGCATDSTPTQTTPEAPPSVAPSAPQTAPVKPLEPGPLPEVDGEITRVDMNDPATQPQPGAWTIVEHTLDDNTCHFDPRTQPSGACQLECGPSTITAVDLGVFTLDAPSLTFFGTCVVVNDAAGFVCEGSTALSQNSSRVDATFLADGTVAGKWTVERPADGPHDACVMKGSFRARPD